MADKGRDKDETTADVLRRDPEPTHLQKTYIVVAEASLNTFKNWYKVLKKLPDGDPRQVGLAVSPSLLHFPFFFFFFFFFFCSVLFVCRHMERKKISIKKSTTATTTAGWYRLQPIAVLNESGPPRCFETFTLV